MRFLETAPVATIIVTALALVGGACLILNGELPHDFTEYAAAVGGSAGVLGIGRGIAAKR